MSYKDLFMLVLYFFGYVVSEFENVAFLNYAK